MHSRSLIIRKTQLALVSAAVVLIVMGAISHHAMVVSTARDRQLRPSQDVLLNLQGFRSSIESFESSVRFFLLTRAESYLDSYPTNGLAADKYDSAVLTLTSDDAKEQSRIPDLDRLAAERLQLGERVIRQRREKVCGGPWIPDWGRGPRISFQGQFVSFRTKS
jgi:CHASE3 domain sensor protein